MFNYYFTYWDELPADSGYDLFGKVHIIWLIGIILAVFVCSSLYLKWGVTTQNRFLKILSITMLIMEVYKDCVLAATGYMQFQYLPLQLCGIAIFIEALFVFFPCSFLGELMCVVCLPGAASALIFPDWLRYPTINFMNLHSFIIHGILVLIPILVMISRKYTPDIRHIYMPLLFFAIATPIIYRINVWQQTNFMFLNHPSNDSPFETIYLHYGYGCYLAVFGGIVLIVILVMYGLTALMKPKF